MHHYDGENDNSIPFCDKILCVTTEATKVLQHVLEGDAPPYD